MLAGCLKVSLLLGPTLTERETSPEIIVRHMSLLIVGVSRGLEELIVLLNQRISSSLVITPTFLPHTKRAGNGRGSARRNRQSENQYRRRRRVYRICSSELARKMASKERSPCSILNDRSAKSGSQTFIVCRVCHGVDNDWRSPRGGGRRSGSIITGRRYA